MLEKADAIECSTVSGTIFVKNLEFEKRVAVKYTTDGWKTHSFCEAAFVMPGDQPGIRWALESNSVVGSTDDAQSWDQFSFTQVQLVIEKGARSHTLALNFLQIRH